MSAPDNEPTPAIAEQLAALRAEVASLRTDLQRGLRFVHAHGHEGQQVLRQQASVVNALGHVLTRAGTIDKEAVAQAQKRWFEAQPLPRFRVRIAPEIDKYSDDVDVVTLDCAARLHLCRAACCYKPFALGSQDLNEGVVQWDIGDPYVNRRRDDGACVHLSEGRCGCYEQRPLWCRTSDCRGDASIWVDFDRRIPNPKLTELPMPANAQGAPEAEADKTSASAKKRKQQVAPKKTVKQKKAPKKKAAKKKGDNKEAAEKKTAKKKAAEKKTAKKKAAEKKTTKKKTAKEKTAKEKTAKKKAATKKTATKKSAKKQRKTATDKGGKRAGPRDDKATDG